MPSPILVEEYRLAPNPAGVEAEWERLNLEVEFLKGRELGALVKPFRVGVSYVEMEEAREDER